MNARKDALTLEVLLKGAENKLVDFGPPLDYRELCPAFSIERFSLWEYQDKKEFEIVLVRAAELPTARLEGRLYTLSDRELLSLDKKRGVGYTCDRKRIPVLVPAANEYGQCATVYTSAYIGRNTHWVERIKYSAQQRIPQNRTFRQYDPLPHEDPFLHNRVAFLTQLEEPKYGVIGQVSPEMALDVKVKNSRWDPLPPKKTSWFKRKVNDFEDI